MTLDHIAEIILIEMSRMQRMALQLANYDPLTDEFLLTDETIEEENYDIAIAA